MRVPMLYSINMTTNQAQEKCVHEDEWEENAGDIASIAPSARWDVTDLAEYSICPGRTHHKYVLHELGSESVPAVLGKVEHAVRANLTKRLLGIYVTSERIDDIVAHAYPAIDSCIQETVKTATDAKSARSEIIAEFATNLKERLSKEEDIRAYKARYLLRKGLTSLDIARTLLPSRVEYPVWSDKFAGRIDAVFEFGDKVVPVEYKTCGFWPGVDTSSWEIQLAAYCMLLSEKTGKPVDYGILYFTRTLTEVPVIITDTLRVKVEEIIESMEELVSGGLWSECVDSSKCINCLYSEFCKNGKQQLEQAETAATSPSLATPTDQVCVLDRIMAQKGRISIFDEGGDDR